VKWWLVRVFNQNRGVSQPQQYLTARRKQLSFPDLQWGTD
jgi:hypothetical protein